MVQPHFLPLSFTPEAGLALLQDLCSASSPCASFPGHASRAVLSLPLLSWHLVQGWNGVGTW